MRTITTREARGNFSAYLTRVANGEEIIISRRGHKDVVMVSAEKFENLQWFKNVFKAEMLDMLLEVEPELAPIILPKLNELMAGVKEK